MKQLSISLYPSVGLGDRVITDDGEFVINKISGGCAVSPWGILYHLEDLEIHWEPLPGKMGAIELNNRTISLIDINAISPCGNFAYDSNGNLYPIDRLENPDKFKLS